MTPAQKTGIESYQAQLSARFAARRCHCGEPATVVILGCAAVRFAGILIKRAKRDRNVCLRHAPWLERQQGREAA